MKLYIYCLFILTSLGLNLACNSSKSISAITASKMPPNEFRKPLFELSENETLRFDWENIGPKNGAEWGQQITVDLKRSFWCSDYNNFRNLNYGNRDRRAAGLAEQITVMIFRFSDVSVASEYYGFAGGANCAIQRDHWVIITNDGKEHLNQIINQYAGMKFSVKQGPEQQ